MTHDVQIGKSQVSLAQIKRHYYSSHPMINPTRIVPKGPAIDFSAPHDRDRKFA